MDDITRREFVGATAAAITVGGTASETAQAADIGKSPATVSFSLTINERNEKIACDPRVTLLDLLRERFHLTGTKKGCDHGQCGACTVLVNGVRVNSCLLLAVAQDGNSVTTIEGIATPAGLHPLQAAFIEHDGFQCGFCTSGQICSALGMLKEWDAEPAKSSDLSDSEIRERMAGNICRCGAYPNIVAAVRHAHQSLKA